MDGGDWGYPTELPERARAALDKIGELAAGVPALSELEPDEARRIADRIWNPYARSLLADAVAISETTLPLPTGEMPIRIYDPAPGTPQPLFIFIHGGGWVLLHPTAFDRVCEELAVSLGSKIVSLDYPLAPESPCPSAIDACVAAVEYLHAHPPAGVSTARAAAIGGDSAGANLSLATLLRLKGRPASPAAGVLFYGVYGDNHQTRSHQTYGGGSYYLTTADMEWFWRQYCGGDAAIRADAKLLEADLAGLPPLYLAAAEFDCLRDDTAALADRLARTAVPHRLRLMEGAFHGSLMLSPFFPEFAALRREIADFLG